MMRYRLRSAYNTLLQTEEEHEATAVSNQLEVDDLDHYHHCPRHNRNHDPYRRCRYCSNKQEYVSSRQQPCCHLVYLWLLLLLVVISISIYLVIWKNYLFLLLQPSSNRLNFQARFDQQRAKLQASHDQWRRKEPWTTPSTTTTTPTTHNHNSINYSHISKKKSLPAPPKWLLDYWDWHVQVRSNHTLFMSNKLLIVSIQSKTAGGLADRLRSLPYFIWEAALTQRIFLMEWTRPCAMEELFWPPAGGIDWTVPATMHTTTIHDSSKHNHDNHNTTSTTTWYTTTTANNNNNMLHQQPAQYEPFRIVLTQPNHESFVVGMPYMEQRMDLSETDLIQFYKHVYELLLTPSPPVQKLLDSTMETMGLRSSSRGDDDDHSHKNTSPFWAIHLRARYPGSSDAFQTSSFFARSVDADGFKMTPKAKAELTRLFQLAITCLYHSSASKTITKTSSSTTATTENHTLPQRLYFASDSNEAVRYLTQQQQQHKILDAHTMSNKVESVKVVGMVTPYERFHLNRNDRIGGGLRKTPPMAFYPAVVDLWIMKQAQCMAIGKGGYGLLAARLGGIDCLVFHQQPNDFASGGGGGGGSLLAETC